MQRFLLGLFKNRYVVYLFLFIFTFIIISSPVYVFVLSFHTGNAIIALYKGLDGRVWYSLFIKNLAHYSSH